MTETSIGKGQPRRDRFLATTFTCLLLLSPLTEGRPAPTRDAPSQAAPPRTTVWHGAQDLAIYALGLIGVDYKFGGTTPDRGLDCSGLVRYVFQQVTGVTLPRTSQELSRLGTQVAVTELVPGDLVFFNTRRLQFSHVGIYLGEDRFIHAPRQGGEVEIVTLSKGYWQKRFDGARRLVGALPDLIPSARAETAAVDAELPVAAGPWNPVGSSSLTPEELLP